MRTLSPQRHKRENNRPADGVSTQSNRSTRLSYQWSQLNAAVNRRANAISVTDSSLAIHLSVVEDSGANTGRRRAVERDGAWITQGHPVAGQVKPWTLAAISARGARRWPNDIALVDAAHRTTFAELHRKVLAVAVQLRELGVKPGMRVAIVGERATQTITAVLAISTVGATYVAVDPRQPEARLQWLLEDADVCGVIGDPGARPSLSSKGDGRFFLSTTELATGETSGDPTRLAHVFPPVDESDVAYILYTSGSTGLPKGVQIEHRNVLAFFNAHNERVRIRHGDRCLNTGHLHFDVSVMDILLPLHVGATVYFSPRTPIPTLILGMLSEHRITHFYAVGSLLGLITGDGRRISQFDLSALRVLQTGAEVCNVRVVNEWLGRWPALRFLNSYGPTEVTVGCVSYLKPEAGPLGEADCPIGRPHRGTQVRIIDTGGRVIRDREITGELVVGGSQVMRGYWRRPIDDEHAFVFLDGERFYRTGDQVFVDADGNYHFVGRRDDEIKLSGFRIHLNEVRRCLDGDSHVANAEVGVVKTEHSEIAAMLLLMPTCSPRNAKDVVKRTSTILPDYMLPTRWVILATMPGTSSGKADRIKVLLALEAAIENQDAPIYVENHGKFEPLEDS